MEADVVVNARFLSRRITGVERYAGEILRCLGKRVRIVGNSRSIKGFSGHAWEQLILPWQLSDRSVLWSPANTGPLAVSNQVLTLHDLSPLEHPEWFRPDFAWWYQVFLPRLVHRVRLIVTSSEYTRHKVMARFGLPGDRVAVIHGGVDRSRFMPRPNPRPSGDYILFLGSLEPRKNLAVLLKAWMGIEAKYPDKSLVIGGSAGEVFRSYKPGEELRRVRFAGYVAETELPDLYKGAAAFVLPSFDEGFGLTVLEAMACGVPVLAANRGALPEVVGTAGLLFDPEDPMALADSLECCLSEKDLRHDLREKGLERVKQFSWSSAAEKLWGLLQVNHGG